MRKEREVSHFMRATVMFGAGDVRIEYVPDATIVEPTDALIRVTRACICGSDLHPYHQMERSESGTRMGHEAVGVVEDVGSEVTKIEKGDLVVMPFASSDGTCEFCREGLPTACVHVGFFGTGRDNIGGAQAEAVRVPYADGTLFKLPVGEDDALMPSLLTLSDVMGRATTRPWSPGSARARAWPWSATAPSAFAASSPPGASAPSRSSSWAATTTGSRWRGSSALRTS